jgi:hypothetical protein
MISHGCHIVILVKPKLMNKGFRSIQDCNGDRGNCLEHRNQMGIF